MIRPLVVARGKALDIARSDARANGFRVVAGFGSDSNDGRPTVHIGKVTTDADMQAAIAVAAAGNGVIIEAPDNPRLLAALVDDLRRIGASDVTLTPPDDRLTRQEQTLLVLLAEGSSVSAAAIAIHVSRRTAQRLLARAKKKLRVETTVEAIAAATSTDT